MLLLLKAALRRVWLAAVVFVLVTGLAWSPALEPTYPVLAAVVISASFLPWVWTLLRFGVLAAVVAAWVVRVCTTAPTWNPSLWYGPRVLLGAALILALAAYGCHTALAGRPVFRGNVFGEEDASVGLGT